MNPHIVGLVEDKSVIRSAINDVSADVLITSTSAWEERCGWDWERALSEIPQETRNADDKKTGSEGEVTHLATLNPTINA